MPTKQLMLTKEKKIKYTLGRDNKIKGDMQRIRITQGCYKGCANCYEPYEVELYLDIIDKIEKNKVVIIDMNIIDYRKPRIEILKKLIKKRVNKKKVYYEINCGFDFTQINQEIADLLFKANLGVFNRKNKWEKNIKLAWDRRLKDQTPLLKAIKYLEKAGFKRDQISMYMLINHNVPLWECDLKLDLMKKWNMKVCPCCFDGGFKVAIPEKWSRKQIDYFSHKCSLHNQIMNWDLYPDINRALNTRKKCRGIYT